MADNQVKKVKPAGREEKFDLTYTYFATEKEKNKMKSGNGERFENDALLKMLGFTENENGEMSIKAYDGGKVRASKEQDER